MLGKRLTVDERRGMAFTGPGVIVTLLLIIYPIFSILQLSFSSVSFGDFEFAGLANYMDVFQSALFSIMIKNTAIWTVGTVIGAFLLGTFAAIVLNQEFVVAKNMWRTILLLSWITPGVVKAVLWKWLYSSDFGMVNHMLQSAHLISEPISWLSDTHLTLWAVMFVQVWETFPFVMLMMTAGLQTIPKDLYEAADLDGATLFQRLRYILVPMLKDIIFIALLTLTIWSLNGFILIWIMTQGGPAGSTTVLALSIYEQFRSFNFNAAAATSVLQLMVSLVFAVWYIRKTGKEE
jgi:ABC-type sugar transport system permease subunit